jgi:hypothetical protein
MIALVIMMWVRGRGLVGGIGGGSGKGFWFTVEAKSGNEYLFPPSRYFRAAMGKGLRETRTRFAQSGTGFLETGTAFCERRTA